MKQEEFEWLKKWTGHVVHSFAFNKIEVAISSANKEYPPPIDEEENDREVALCDIHKPVTYYVDEGCPECRLEEPKPDLKVKIGGGHCVGHDTDFISKDGHYYCPKCFPDGIRITKFMIPCDMYDGAGGCMRKKLDDVRNMSCEGESLRHLTISEIKKLADDWKPSNDCHHHLFVPKEKSK